MNRTVKAVALGGLVALTLTACATTESGEMGLQYGGGMGEAREFVECVNPNTTSGVGPGDFVYFYPVGQRDFRFTGGEGADADPIKTTTKGDGAGNPGIEMLVPGVTKFTLSSDCDALRQFHEKIGASKHVASESAGEVGAGWRGFILSNLAVATERAIDNTSPAYTSTELYNNPAKRAEWEKAIAETLPKILSDLLGSDFVKVDSVVINTPDLPAAVKNGVVAQEEARVRQQAAETDLKTAEKFGGIAGYTAYLADMANLRLQESIARGINEGRLSPAVVPQGSSIMVPK